MKMNKKAASLLLTSAVFLTNTAFAANEINAYISDNTITVEQSSLYEKSVNGKKGIFVYYDKNGTLCGVTMSDIFGGEFNAKPHGEYETVQLFVPNGAESEIYTLNLTEKKTTEPEPTTETTGNTAIEPTDETEDETDGHYGYHDYGYDNEDNADSSENSEKAESVCTITIDCSAVFRYEEASDEVLSALPSDGFILPRTDITLTDGMTAYDVLKQACEGRGIEITGSSSYVSGINGLSEFSCGPLSGWMYSVNGEFPTVPMNEYIVGENDEIAVRYTCRLGEDL